MIACTPNSDSCISMTGAGAMRFRPVVAMKSPIMLISGFSAFAAAVPAPPRRTGSCGTLWPAAWRWASGDVGEVVAVAACDVAEAPPGAAAPGAGDCDFNIRTCPSSAMMRSSRSLIFCSRAALLLPPWLTVGCWASRGDVTSSAQMAMCFLIRDSFENP